MKSASKVSPKKESRSLNISSNRSSSGKNAKIRIIQASIKRKLLLNRTSLLSDKVFLPDLLLHDDKYGNVSKVQKFLKSTLLINRFTLDMRNYYYNYIVMTIVAKLTMIILSTTILPKHAHTTGYDRQLHTTVIESSIR